MRDESNIITGDTPSYQQEVDLQLLDRSNEFKQEVGRGVADLETKVELIFIEEKEEVPQVDPSPPRQKTFAEKLAGARKVLVGNSATPPHDDL